MQSLDKGQAFADLSSSASYTAVETIAEKLIGKQHDSSSAVQQETS